jgi:phosphatidylinositol phospholipase C, delta
MVFHGKTLTSKVSVRDVCKAIAKYAFVASPYPVIISAEIHCGLAQQETMAKIMNEVFGTAIVSAPVEGRARIEALPSPEDLKGKFLLKVHRSAFSPALEDLIHFQAKNVYVVAEQEALRGKDSVIDSESEEASAADSDAAQDVKFHRRKSSGPVKGTFLALPHVLSLTDLFYGKELKHEFAKARNVVDRVRGIAPTPPPQASPLPLTPPHKSERPPVKMSLALVAMLVYTVGVKCRGLNKKEEYAPEHVFSLSENTANKFLKQDMVDLIKHTRSHIIRIYPKGLRLNSTNYEPHRFWAAGAQLVAINWQTCGADIDISSGGCP